MDRNVFIYWVGKEYSLIKLLRKTIYRHATNGRGYNVHFITDKNLNEYIKDVPSWFHIVLPAVQADYIRVQVICERGGIWLDSDTLVVDSLDPLFDIIERKDGFLLKENNEKLCNGVFGSKPRTPLLLEWKRLQTSIMERERGNVTWTAIGNGILETLHKENPSVYSNYEIMNGLDTMYPVNWDKCVTEFIEKPYDNYKNIVRNFQPLIVLVNYVYRKLESMTEEQILKGVMPLNYFLNESQARAPSQDTPVHSSTTDISSVLAVVKKTKRVGIVIHDKAGLFSNGIIQNGYFLYQCLEAMGYTCQFLCDEANPSPFEHDGLSVKQITTDPSIFNPYDYHTIITITRRISPEVYALCNNNKVGVASLVCGNCYVMDQEDFVKDRTDGVITFLGGSRNIDVQWVIPSYHHSLEYLELIRNKPAVLVPHLWHPSILNHYTPRLLNKPYSALFFDATKPVHKKINIVIMEPNMSTMKTAWMPILACEKLHIQHPELIEHVFVFNYPSHKNAWDMIESLTVASKVRKFNRKSVAEIMYHFNSQSDRFPIFLSHQMLNSLNYIYYELLYYGYPLVHNSPDLDGCGYLYPENHISKCVEQILCAHRTHNSTLETYKANATKYLNRVDPFDVEVQAAFETRMVASMTATLCRASTDAPKKEPSDLKTVFTDIYTNGIWKDDRADSPLSGPGSSLASSKGFCEFIDTVCRTKNIKTVVDIGCGDLTWMPTTAAFRNLVYTGIDIVPSLIESHKVNYPRHTFLTLNVVSEEVPPGDLVILRDVLFHLSHADILKVLRNIKDKFKYYVVTSCNNKINDDTLDKYHYHRVNLTIDPFNLTHHRETLREPEFDRNVFLFDNHLL
jgi:hypothetical protein